ncbi:MAG TPA: hypothetical protein PLP26_10555 [Ilumatobacteraceae bacterium]|nr:hypothetical protein [Ilumatobacteraceae bacterium]
MKPDSSITNPEPEPARVAAEPNSGVTYEPVVSIRTVAARNTDAPSTSVGSDWVVDGALATRIVAVDSPPVLEQPTINTAGNKPDSSFRQPHIIWPPSGDTRNSAPPQTRPMSQDANDRFGLTHNAARATQPADPAGR